MSTWSDWEQRLKGNFSIFSNSVPPPIDPNPGDTDLLLLSPAKLGILTGLVVAYFVHAKINSALNGNAKWSKQGHQIHEIINAKWKYVVKVCLVFALFVLLSPLLLAIIVAFQFYRLAAILLIKLLVGSKYVRMMEGHDAVWAVENPKWRSVINVLVTFEGEKEAVDILLALRKRLASKMINEHHAFAKLFFRKGSRFGYSYWTRPNLKDTSIEDYIRFISIPSKEEDLLSENELKSWIGEHYNAKLPFNHEASWEILVSRTPLKSDTVGLKRYPILFRVHHSLGDGVALLRCMLETIAERRQSVVDLWHQCTPTRVKNLMTITAEELEMTQKAVSRRQFMPSVKVVINFNGILQRVMNALYYFGLFLAAPLALAEQAVSRLADNNFIHNPTNQELNGETVIEWFSEAQEDLFPKIKAIKNVIPEARFSDVFLTALSASLHDLFLTKRYPVPDQITGVIPIRMEPTSCNLSIQNRFSVGLQTIPILPPSTDVESLHKHVLATKSWTDDLRGKPDYLVNYWILSYASSLLPKQVLGPMVFSKHSSMVVSNLPGPKDPVTIQRFTVRDLAFWLPYRGTTGFGVTLLTYNNKLQIGVGADKSILGDQSDAKFILNRTIEELERMYEITSIY